MTTRYYDDGETYAYLDSGRLILTEAAPAHFERTGKLDLSGNLDLTGCPSVCALSGSFFGVASA